ncbi:hypothetical protein FRB93_005838 [Tulasnella sp. JGI-2019a]|nr:hypothetical protein FRB93_005838 [Tulasnella sp. JGI-2019a]
MAASSLPMLKRGEACCECRRRKLRCDGEKPACSVCTLAHRECRYVRPVTRPVSVVLQERLARLEAEYARLTTQAQVAQSAPVPVMQQATRRRSSVLTTAPVLLQPSQMEGNWWEPEDLTPSVRDHLLGIFMENSPKIFFWMHGPTFSARLESQTNPPHRALLEPMYLMACYFTSRSASSISFAEHEAHFLDRARHALEESLSYSDRLMDFLRGSVLVTAYLFLRGRYIEGYHANCGGANFAVSCNLHGITSHVFRANAQDMPASSGSYLIGQPVSQIDLGERILTFWSIFVWDKVSSIVTGFLSAMPSEGNFIDTIETVFPKTLEEYASGEVDDLDKESIRDLLEPHRASFTPAGMAQEPNKYATNIQGLILLERAIRLVSNYRAQFKLQSSPKVTPGGFTSPSTVRSPPSSPSVTPYNVTDCEVAIVALQKHLTTSLRFASISAHSGPTNVSNGGSVEMKPQQVIAQSLALGSLMVIYNARADIDPAQYDQRLATSREFADMTKYIPINAYVDYPFSSLGYCGCLAAQVLLNHIQQLQSQNPQTAEAIKEASDCEHSLAHLIEALNRVGASNPGYKQLQQVYQFLVQVEPEAET